MRGKGKCALGVLAVSFAFLCLAGDASALSYVALGDSLAVGSGDGGGGGYVARYRDDLATDLEAPVVLQNLGVGGSTSQDLLDSLTTDSMVQSAVADADVVTFDIGGNDILIALFAFKGGTCGGADGQDCLRQAAAGFDANWPAILTQLRMLNHGAMMRTMTYYNSLIVDLDPGDGTAATVKPYLTALNATIRSTAPNAGIAVAEGITAFNGRSGNEDPIAKGYIDADHIHPSPLGYDVLGEAFHGLGYSPIPGATVRIPSTLQLRDDVVPPLDPSQRKFSFVAKSTPAIGPSGRIVPPPPGLPEDPRTTGAMLTVYNGAGLTMDIAPFSLPATGWTLIGTNGYRFRGSGTVSQALIVADKIIVKAKGAGLDYSLDEPSQGVVAVTLTLGGGGWCAAAPAKSSGSPPSTAAHDHPGKFLGQKNAPPPATCPPEPGSPTTTTTITTTTTSSSGTSTIPSCAGSACSGCGACGDGVCFAAGSGTCTHSGPGAVCASNASCSVSACSSDTDCGPGKVCGIAGMFTVCCAVCP